METNRLLFIGALPCGCSLWTLSQRPRVWPEYCAEHQVGQMPGASRFLGGYGWWLRPLRPSEEE